MLFSIIAYIIAGFYENFLWVKWNLNVTHFSGKNDPNINSFGPIKIREINPCQISLREILMDFSPRMKQQIKQINQKQQTPYCNKTDFVKAEMVNKYTTRIIIPGGIFRPAAIRRPRSLIHLGTGQTNVFRWENWQLHGSVRVPTWYIITIKNGPLRKRKTEISFVLEEQTSYLTAIPDLMLINSLLPNNTVMAYHKDNRYCGRTKAAKVGMYNVRHLTQKRYEQCFQYHNNTNICSKKQEPQCKYAVGSLALAMKKSGILPDL